MKKALILLCFFSVTLLSAQNYSSDSKRAGKLYTEARNHFSQKQDQKAEELLQKVVDLDSMHYEAWFMLAQISLDRRNYEASVDYYLNGLYAAPDINKSGFLKIAEMEYNLGKYQDAQTHLERWESYRIRDIRSEEKAIKLKENLQFALEAIAHPVSFNPEPLKGEVNTEGYEYWPSLSVDEKTIFFTVLRPQDPSLPRTNLDLQEDFCFCENIDGQWENRTYLGHPVNSNTNEGAQSITADGKYIYFTACDRPDGHGRFCDLYYSKVLPDGSWTEPVNLGDNINTSSSEKHPSISPDGRVLYFASNRGGGKGGYDIWMSVKNGEAWSKPVNMGDSINTPGVEQSPFIHPDQRSLYFSSTGWPGLGQEDIYLSRLKQDGSWSRPKNLGYPINTNNEEIGFVVNAMGNKAYYSSNRREGTDTDIYSFEMPEELRPDPVSYVSGRVFDARSYRGISAVIQLFNLKTGALFMESESKEGEGDYLIGLPTGSEFAFSVSHPGYLFYSDNFMLEKNYSKIDPKIVDIPLDPIVQGKKIVLKNIFYETDSYTLKAESRIELQKVIELLQLNPRIKIEISGHTDNTGSEDYNLELSVKRATEVVKYLISNGINEERLKAAGYGAGIPLEDNDSEAGRARNRRTELKIL